VLIHAICDALLGAANLRDIGYHFPDTAPEYKGADSKVLLSRTVDLLAQHGYRVGNVDCTVCAERPKINPHIDAMKAVLAPLLRVDLDAVSLKATTSERMGFVGREEGMAAHAVALIERV
jgi:ygbB family